MTYETHDSGKRSEYESGMVRDTNEGKPRFDLTMPLDCPYEEQMLTRWAALMARGAQKYDARNWEKASGEEELARFRESAFRHLIMWLSGTNDGEDHAAAVFFNITAAEYVKRRLNGALSRGGYVFDFHVGDGEQAAHAISDALKQYKRKGGK